MNFRRRAENHGLSRAFRLDFFVCPIRQAWTLLHLTLGVQGQLKTTPGHRCTELITAFYMPPAEFSFFSQMLDIILPKCV